MKEERKVDNCSNRHYEKRLLKRPMRNFVRFPNVGHACKMPAWGQAGIAFSVIFDPLPQSSNDEHSHFHDDLSLPLS